MSCVARNVLMGAVALLGFVPLSARTAPFTYQGRLADATGPANGVFDLRFSVHDLSGGGTLVAGPLTNSATVVSNGLFTLTLDFGEGVFTGPERWLEIAVRTNGSSSDYQPLSPRQRLTPAPYATYASSAPASGLQGALTPGQLPVVTVTNGASGVTLSGNFSGNGTALTGVNAVSVGDVTAAGLWQLGGNTAAPGQFLGTTNNQPLELRAGGSRVLQLATEPDWGNVRIAGGSPANISSGYGSTVSGGGATNYLFAPRSWANIASGDFTALSGGAGNQAQGNFSSIAGGRENVVTGSYSAIGGGTGNTNGGSYAVIGGGAGNTNQGSYATIAGGTGNAATGQESVIGGGIGNHTGARGATIAGGAANLASGPGAAVGGGGYNGSLWRGNEATAPASTIAGGFQNKANGEGAFVGGGSYNVSGYHSVVAGGFMNTSTGSFSVATIAGGRENYADGTFSTISGGYANTNNGYAATIGGGYQNRSIGDSATVGGGIGNQANGTRATVSGGALNTASGSHATVPGGYGNAAAGAFTFAAGQNAKATNAGSFVWADTQGTAFSDTTSNQFLVRAQNGVGINTNNPQAALHVHGEARLNGLVRMGSESGTSNSFTAPGLIQRRVESYDSSIGQIVARTDLLTLERDGTVSGLIVRYPPNPGRQVINAIGLNSAGALVPFRTVLNNPGSGGFVQVYSSAQRIVHAQISFGNTYNQATRLTQVVLDRTDDGSGIDDFYWVGTLASNFNQ